MSTTVINMNQPILKIADTEAGLGAGTAYECQLTSAQLVPTAVTNAVPATGCSPATNIPSKSTWTLVLNFLQDWTVANSLSSYAVEHETELVWFSLTLDLDTPTVVTTGQAWVAAGQYGGTFGGPPAVANATWPVLGTPTFPPVVPPVVADPTDTPPTPTPTDTDTGYGTPVAV